MGFELLAPRQKQWVESLDLTRNAASIAGAEGDPGSGDKKHRASQLSLVRAGWHALVRRLSHTLFYSRSGKSCNRLGTILATLVPHSPAARPPDGLRHVRTDAGLARQHGRTLLLGKSFQRLALTATTR